MTLTMTQSTIKKYIFLDIDGVINPLKVKGGDTRITINFGEGFGKYKITISQYIAGYLHELIEDGFQIVWASTWCHWWPEQIEELARHYELPADLPKIDLSWWGDAHGIDLSDGCGKLGGIIGWCQENHIELYKDIILWVDDQLTGEDWIWANTFGVCAVKPNPASGLRDINAVAKINKFLENLRKT